MAEPAGPGKAPEIVYDYPGHATDDAAIKKVEDALASKYSETYKKGLASAADKAPIDEKEAHGKIDKAKKDANQEAISNPDAVAKENKESPPPPMQVSSMKPQLHPSNPTTAGPKAPQGGTPHVAPAPPAKTPATGGVPPSVPEPAPPQPLVLQALAKGGDLDGFLDGYNPKSPETKEHLSKISEMKEIAKGFDGQVEGIVNHGGGAFNTAKAAATDFFNSKKEASQLSKTENPYAKVNDDHKNIMVGVSRVQAFVSIVGNVCTKLGLILTILGLFGFIFPPIGAAIQAVARVLNIVGLICDALGAILSSVLVGLNGVVLARMIGKGASNEEKAAAADQMMGEANAAGGHIMNLALAYGGKFMGGIKNASKGVVGSLFKRFKGVVGKFTSKTLGPVANWAKKLGYKFGFGLEKAGASASPGMMSKAASKVGSWGKAAWNSPKTLIEKARETSWVKKVNESGFSKGLQSASGKFNSSWVAKLDGSGLEGLGEKAGGKVFTKNLEKRMEDAAQAEAHDAFKAAEANTVKDAGNKERAQIEREIKAQREQGQALEEESTAGPQLDEGKATASREAYEKADSLEEGEDKAVTKAETKAKKEGEREWDKKVEEEKAEKKEEAAKERREEEDKKEWLEDQNKFNKRTERMERDLRTQERRANSPNVSASNKEIARKEAEKIREKLEERKQIPAIAGGRELEQPKTLWDVGKKGVYDPIHEVHEEKEKEEKRLEYAEQSGPEWQWRFTVKNGTGGHADQEKVEADERHEKLEAWEASPAPETSTSEQVETMLAGLDEELGMEPAPVDGGAEPDAPDAAVCVPDGATEQAPDAATVAAPREEPTKPTGGEAKQEEPQDTQTPELVYWPSLVGDKGEFAKAAGELGDMKKIAFAFRKSQAEAKKKAIEAARAFHDYSEDEKKKAQHAQAHGASQQASVADATASGAAADQGGTNAAQGTAKQNEAQGPANGAPEQGPDPGGKPGLLHPIKRIWWYVKKWVSDKAQAVFGFIQEQIASLVLKAVCGISMNDLKGYTTALHHRMEYSKLVGTKGINDAKTAMQQNIASEGKAKSYEQQAWDDALECDRNMGDADAFVKQVEDTERDLAAEQAKATQFINELRAAYQAEKARQAEEKQKKLAEQKQQAAAPGDGGGAAAPVVAVVPKQPTLTDKVPPAPKPLNPAAISKVKNAADYVVKQADLVVQQLTDSRKIEAAKLKEKLGDKGILKRLTFNTSHVGDKVLASAQDSAAQIKTSVAQVSSSLPTTAADLSRDAGQVKSKAQAVDELSHIGFENLNAAFKASYEALGKG